MPASVAAYGVILHLGKLGESDRLVDVLTREHGRVRCVARGARASKRRFAGIVDLFVSLQMQLGVGRGGGLWTLAAADLRQARLGIRGHLEAIMRAGALCALVRQLVPLHQAAPEMLAALEAGLDSLADARLAAAGAAFARIAQAAGFLPALCCRRCARQDRPLGVEATGSLICLACAPKVEPLRPAVLQALAGGPVADEGVAVELQACVQALVAGGGGL